MKHYRVFFLKSDVLAKLIAEEPFAPLANRKEAEQIEDFLDSQAEQGWFLKEVVLYPGSTTDAIEDLLIILEKSEK